MRKNELYHLIQRENCRVVITVIGGLRGHIFGRGNQQLSPRIIRNLGMANITYYCHEEKTFDLAASSLIVDTGDVKLDQELSGFARVITGYHDSMMFPIRA